MYYSELIAKELVNYQDGKRLGFAGAYDLMIDAYSGKLLALVIDKRSLFGGRQGEEDIIPWEEISRIGQDVIILDV